MSYAMNVVWITTLDFSLRGGYGTLSDELSSHTFIIRHNQAGQYRHVVTNYEHMVINNDYLLNYTRPYPFRKRSAYLYLSFSLFIVASDSLT